MTKASGQTDGSRRKPSRHPMSAGTSPPSLGARIRSVDWATIGAELDARGCATISGLLTADDCTAMTALYDQDARFRSTIVMARYGFGSGEYRYFGYPLPRLVAGLRQQLYARLAPVANRWAEALGDHTHYPDRLPAFLEHCHAKGQRRPTPLLLRYRAGDYNCLHQDLYGAVAFPLQVTLCLSRRGADFTGGEFLLVEQRPRAQSRGEAVILDQGDAVIFANRYRPVMGKRGPYRVNLRHGVSRLHSGERHALGIIFHDAA